MKVGAVVIFYNPLRSYFENIFNISNQVNLLVIVDNSVNPTQYFNSYPNIIYKCYCENQGLAKALNDGIKILLQNEINEIFLFDQDSTIPKSYITNMLQFKYKNLLPNNKIIIAPNFYDINSKSYATFTYLNKYWIENKNCKKQQQLKTTFAITSGTLFGSRIFNEVGFLREDFFIDHIDTEFCLRAKTYDYRVVINCDILLEHSIGERKKYKFFGITFKPNNHNHIRRYYITRNSLFVIKLYWKKFPSFIYLNFLRMTHEILCILLIESNKFKKLFYIFKGLKDFILNKTGKIN